MILEPGCQLAKRRRQAGSRGVLTLRAEGVLMRVARDGRNARHGEVKLGQTVAVARALRERDDERAEAAVDMQARLVLARKRAQVLDGVDDAVREVGGRAHDHDCVRVDKALHRLDVGLARARVDGDDVELDLEVLRRFPERSVSRGRDNPKVSWHRESLGSHLWGGHALDSARPVAVGLARHEDGLGAARGRCCQFRMTRIIHWCQHRSRRGTA